MKQKIIVKVQMNCDKCRTKAMKIAAVEEGVISVAIEGAEKDRVVVIGDGVDSACLTLRLREKLGYATIVSVEEVKEKGNEKPKPAPEPAPKTCQSQQVLIGSMGYADEPNCSIM
ncbi:Heavy metal-associated isoprenylated plant protein 47 [Vitis vinifera]|uniref:Heavy metal-associated isoprenylated plant protein 47 n=1 Tax=Vitis vinifera TaxID=29760 RepID=A0A438ER09_VITVI|nr:Heavy metal-associated isoprenylated plant protein 47 [Vitis vinifera]RVX14613.1 Heavy metal-associated isoprenylated plant protein 47 [Vitis vinifera]